jgi:hypothetical protein
MADDFSPIEPPCLTGCGNLARPGSGVCVECERQFNVEREADERFFQRDYALWLMGHDDGYRRSFIWRDFPAAEIEAFAAEERAAQRRSA